MDKLTDKYWKSELTGLVPNVLIPGILPELKKYRLSKNGISEILGRANSFTRFQVFLKIVPLLKGENYWFGLKEAYQDSDNLFDLRNRVKDAFLKNESGRCTLMNNEEREYYNDLPERITLYRGMTEKELLGGEFGVSWSTKKSVANFFSKKYNRNLKTNHLSKCVHSVIIPKSKVIAFLNDRKEFEVIYIQTET